MLKLNYQVILGSGSPRRKELLNSIISDFEIRVANIDETYPKQMEFNQIAAYLAAEKSKAISIQPNELLISSDTVVRNEKRIYEKPKDAEEAFLFLSELQGKSHFVDTAVCLRTHDKTKTFTISSEVIFYPLSDQEIKYYIETFKPFDKAGAYGIQEWIGYIGVERINGDYQAIVGFPISAIYQTLKTW